MKHRTFIHRVVVTKTSFQILPPWILNIGIWTWTNTNFIKYLYHFKMLSLSIIWNVRWSVGKKLFVRNVTFAAAIQDKLQFLSVHLSITLYVLGTLARKGPTGLEPTSGVRQRKKYLLLLFAIYNRGGEERGRESAQQVAGQSVSKNQPCDVIKMRDYPSLF